MTGPAQKGSPPAGTGVAETGALRRVDAIPTVALGGAAYITAKQLLKGCLIHGRRRVAGHDVLIMTSALDALSVPRPAS